MPMIDIRYKHGKFAARHLTGICDITRSLVEEALECMDPGVRVSPQGDRDHTRGYEFEITIFANYSDKRAENLDESAKHIKKSLDRHLGQALAEEAEEVKFNVWVFLGHAAFADNSG